MSTVRAPVSRLVKQEGVITPFHSTVILAATNAFLTSRLKNSSWLFPSSPNLVFPILDASDLYQIDVTAVAAVLFYLYIYLCSRKREHPILYEQVPQPSLLQRPALAFETLGLLLICGILEIITHPVGVPNLSQSSAVQRRTSSNVE